MLERGLVGPGSGVRVQGGGGGDVREVEVVDEEGADGEGEDGAD